MASTSDSMLKQKSNQNIQVFVRVRPTNAREKLIKSNEVVETNGLKDVVVKQNADSRITKKFTFDRAFGMNSQQHEIYQTVVAPLIQEVIDGYNCTVFAYGQTGTGKTYTMVGEEQSLLSSQYDDISNVGMIPRALTHLFDTLRMNKNEFAMRVSYLELYNEELCDLLSTDDNVKIRIYDDANKKGSVIVQGLEEVPVRCKDDVYKLLAKGQERRKTAATLMNAQSSRSHTVFSILIHIKENGPDGEEMLKIGKLNLVDLAGSENISKAGNEKGIRTRESVNINQSLLTLGRVITALVERAPHIPYRESKLTRLLQESLGGRTKTSIIATISCGHKDLEETLSTLDYAHRAKNIQNKPEINQRLTKKVILKEYNEEIERLKRDLYAAREKNGFYMAAESYNDMVFKMENTEKELNEVMGAFTKVKEELNSKMKLFEETKQNLIATAEQLVITEGKFKITETELSKTKRNLRKIERNYGEAKHIISCHQETEQKLTEQSKEIIKIAEEASCDTKSLQENIRRRKEKDENAAKASNDLLSGLKNSMTGMQNEIMELEKLHKESRDMIISDLSAMKDSNSNFTIHIVDSLQELYGAQKDLHDNLYSNFERWMKQKSDNSSDFVSFKSFFENAKENDERFFNLLNGSVNRILELLSDRKCQENQLYEYMIKRVNEQQKSYVDFANSLQTKLNFYGDQLSSLRSSMKSKNASQNIKIQEMEKLLTQLKTEVSEQDNISQEELSKIRDDIEQNGLSTANFIQLSDMTSSEDVHYLTKEFSQAQEKYDEVIDEIKSTQNTLEKDKEARSKSMNIQVENIICMDEEIKDQINVMRTDFQAKNEGLIQKIKDDSSQTSIKLREIKSVVHHNLHLIVDQAGSKLLQDVSNATSNIDQFRCDEVYLYKSTGETPSRKDYKFNRNLSTTSPHERIIKRFRLEQGLSDSLIHDSSLIEENEVTNFTPRELCNSTAIEIDNAVVESPRTKFLGEEKMNVDDQENLPLN